MKGFTKVASHGLGVRATEYLWVPTSYLIDQLTEIPIAATSETLLDYAIFAIAADDIYFSYWGCIDSGLL